MSRNGEEAPEVLVPFPPPIHRELEPEDRMEGSWKSRPYPQAFWALSEWEKSGEGETSLIGMYSSLVTKSHGKVMESPKMLLTPKNRTRAQLKVGKRDMNLYYLIDELHVYQSLQKEKNVKVICQTFQETSVNKKQSSRI